MRYPGRLFFRSSALVAISLGGVFDVRAELVTTSPFLPPKGQVVAAPVAPPPLELRGITAVENVTMFSIFDPTKKASAWVKLDEAGPGFSVKKYDADTDTVTVDYQGRTLTLVMRSPKIAAAGPAMAAVPMQAPTILPANISPLPAPAPRQIFPNPTPATEAARIAEWNSEIQRRRELRNQTGPTATPNPSAVPGASPPQAPPTPPLAAPGNSQTIRRP